MLLRRTSLATRSWSSRFTRVSTYPRRSLATTADLDNVYDVVIVGGGISGTALACSLATNPLLKDYNVALVEAMDLSSTRNWEPVPDKYSNRVVSLTPASMRFFNNIGVTEQLNAERVHPYNKMRVWDGVTDAKIEFDTGLLAQFGIDTRGSAIAYMIENVHLQHAILRQLTASRGQGASVDIFEKAKVESICLDNAPTDQGLDLSDWPRVKLSNGSSLKARLLVGADGINSPVRNFANIESLGWDYNMQGVVASLKTKKLGNSDSVYQRFLPTGPVALLPLGEGNASMVWSVPPDLAMALKKMPARDFCTLVNAAFRLSVPDLNYLYAQISRTTFETKCDLASEYDWRQSVATHGMTEMQKVEREFEYPPEIEDVDADSRASFPLRMRNSQEYYSNRVVLVGDAAHTIHPLAGQGLNQGLLDVECLVDVLQHGAANGQDLGDTHLLREYASTRYLRNLVMISACDKLHKLYNTDFLPVTWIRSLGLSTINSLDFVKAEIMKYAMGIEYTGKDQDSTANNNFSK